MTEYIEREAALHQIERREKLMVGDKCISVDALKSFIRNRPTADVTEVRHGQWVSSENNNNDGFSHHMCSNCKKDAPFGYIYMEDWDEGMDGEWYSRGFIENGIDEHMGNYCHYCGANMQGGADNAAD